MHAHWSRHARTPFYTEYVWRSELGEHHPGRDRALPSRIDGWAVAGKRILDPVLSLLVLWQEKGPGVNIKVPKKSLEQH